MTIRPYFNKPRVYILMLGLLQKVIIVLSLIVQLIIMRVLIGKGMICLLKKSLLMKVKMLRGLLKKFISHRLLRRK